MGGVTVMAGGSIPHKQRLRADDRLASVVTGCRATRRTFRSAPGACGAALGPSSRGAPWPEPGVVARSALPGGAETSPCSRVLEPAL